LLAGADSSVTAPDCPVAGELNTSMSSASMGAAPTGKGTLRNCLLLSLGCGAGLRVGKVVRLKVKHIDSAQMVIHVEQSKGRKNRLLMLSPDRHSQLREWWALRPTRYDAGVPMQERWLFPGRRKGLHLTQRQVNRVFHGAADAAGIKKAVNLHMCWHLGLTATNTCRRPGNS
jgi:site-specific recombinase XerD